MSTNNYTSSNEEINMENTADLNSRRKKKFTGGNASKRHRDRVNVEFNNLAKLLPFPESVIAKLDKSSILRLAVSYIRAKSFFKGASIHALRRETLSSLIKEGTGVVTEIFSKALDGFLLVLTEDMKVLFVSESVRDYLGYCQAGIIHESFLQFVNPADHSLVQASVNYSKDESDPKNSSRTFGACSPTGFTSESLITRETKDQPPQVHRRFVCRMKCAYSCSSRFYTAYRTFQFSGHLRKSTIQEGREQKNVNTLVVFATPLSTTSNNSNNNENGTTRSESSDVTDTFYQTHVADRKEYIPYETYASGFRIEPTLRPHVAPIPVTAKEQTELRASNDTSSLHHLSRPPPSLISAADRFPTREVPRLIKRESLTSMTFPTKSSSTYNEIFSCDSRYSDHSDDSKCSPVSSPNLSWKQRNLSPGIATCEDRSVGKHEFGRIYGKPSIFETDYNWLKQRTSPELELRGSRPGSRDSSNGDVYTGASMLMSMSGRNARSTSPPNHSFSPETFHHGKRFYADEYSSDDLHVSYKRQRLVSSETKKNKFNISSLLGLDDEKSSAFTEFPKRPSVDERTRLSYEVYR